MTSSGEHHSETPTTSPVSAVRLAEAVLAGREPAVHSPFSLTVPPGEALAVVGGNNSGKSALVRTVLGLLPPVAGRVRVLGVNMYRAASAEVASVRRRLGFVLPEGGLLSAMNVFDNLALQMRYHGMYGEAPVRARVAHWLERFKLDDVATKRPASLSASEARRVATARALVHDPLVVLIDEPFAYLDDKASEVVLEALEEARQRGATLLIATMGGDRIARLVDRHVQIEGGVVRNPTPRESIPGSGEVDLGDVRRRLASNEAALPFLDADHDVT